MAKMTFKDSVFGEETFWLRANGHIYRTTHNSNDLLVADFRPVVCSADTFEESVCRWRRLRSQSLTHHQHTGETR